MLGSARIYTICIVAVLILAAPVSVSAFDSELCIAQKLVEPNTPATVHDIADLIQEDLAKLTPEDRLSARYFYLDTPHAGDAGHADLQAQREALVKVLNGLTWSKDLQIPIELGPNQTLLRVDLKKLGWTDKAWDTLLKSVDRHSAFHNLHPYIDTFKKDTGTQFPAIRGDIFTIGTIQDIAANTGGVVPVDTYYDLLGINGNIRTLESKLGINTDQNIAQGNVLRAGFSKSGVSKNNRVVERHETNYGGAYWKTYDFKPVEQNRTPPDRRSIFAYPKSFDEDGGEVIFHLPNGMQAYALFDKAGNMIAKADPEIVSDPKRRDRAVENAVSCMGCHAAGLNPVKDEIRDHLRANFRAFNLKDHQFINRLHPENSQIRTALERDNQVFLSALAQLRTTEMPIDVITPVVARYEADVSIDQAALELGITRPALEKFIRERRHAFPELALLISNKKIPRGEFQHLLPTLAVATIMPERFRTTLSNYGVVDANATTLAVQPYAYYPIEARAFLIENQDGSQRVEVGLGSIQGANLILQTSKGTAAYPISQIKAHTTKPLSDFVLVDNPPRYGRKTTQSDSSDVVSFLESSKSVNEYLGRVLVGPLYLEQYTSIEKARVLYLKSITEFPEKITEVENGRIDSAAYRELRTAFNAADAGRIVFEVRQLIRQNVDRKLAEATKLKSELDPQAPAAARILGKILDQKAYSFEKTRAIQTLAANPCAEATFVLISKGLTDSNASVSTDAFNVLQKRSLTDDELKLLAIAAPDNRYAAELLKLFHLNGP